MKKYLLLFVLIVLPLLSALQAQSGWTSQKGHGFFKLNQGIIRAGAFFNPDGDIVDITTTSVYTTTLYGEFGITNRLTALLHAPLFVRSTINNRESTVDGVVIPGDEFNGIGDVQFGLKYGLLASGPVVMSLSGEVKLPSGNPVGGETELLQSGDGAWGFLGLVSASHSFYPTPVYVSLYGGYQWRGEATLDYRSGPLSVDYDDAVHWGGEVGFTPGDHWQLAFKWRQVIALESDGNEGVTGNSSIFGNRISYFSFNPEVSYVIGQHFGLSASIGGAFSARNILAAPNYGLGVFVLFQ